LFKALLAVRAPADDDGGGVALLQEVEKSVETKITTAKERYDFIMSSAATIVHLNEWKTGHFNSGFARQ
jgi:hypothetical protein